MPVKITCDGEYIKKNSLQTKRLRPTYGTKEGEQKLNIRNKETSGAISSDRIRPGCHVMVVEKCVC